MKKGPDGGGRGHWYCFLQETIASRTTEAKGSNSLAKNNRLQITDDHIWKELDCKYQLTISNI